jgi:hypothetical protein
MENITKFKKISFSQYQKDLEKNNIETINNSLFFRID